MSVSDGAMRHVPSASSEGCQSARNARARTRVVDGIESGIGLVYTGLLASGALPSSVKRTTAPGVAVASVSESAAA